MAPMKSEYKIEPVRVVWHIEEFDSFLLANEPNYVTSPEIIAYLPNPTKWCFKLYVKGEDTVKICLKNKNDFKIRINYEIRVPIRGEYMLYYRDIHTFRPDEEIGINHDLRALQNRGSGFTNKCRISFILGTPSYKSHFKIDHALLTDIESLYRQRNLADFILGFDGEEFLVHLALLRVRAPQLENFLRNHFDANAFEEFLKAEGITMKGLEIFLRYIYCGHLWKIMAEKCKIFNNKCKSVEIDENANIKDLVCNSCSNILQQVYKMSVIFGMVNLKEELDPPGRYETVEISYGRVSRTFFWNVNFSELIAEGSEQISRNLEIQHVLLEISVCMKRDKCNNEIFQFALQLLPPAPETETFLKFDISVLTLKLKMPHLEGRICMKPSTKLVRLLPTFLRKSFPKKIQEQFLHSGDLIFVINLTLPHNAKSDYRYERGRLNRPARIYNYISFRESILGICPTSDDKVVIHIGNETLEVSKFILCARSPVFRAMFSTSMIEGIKSMVNIPHIDFRTFNYFVKYIQYGKLPRKTKLKGKGIDLWLELLQVADMYFVQSLDIECIEVLKRNLNIRNVFKVMQMAHYLKKEDLLVSSRNLILYEFEKTLQNCNFDVKECYSILQDSRTFCQYEH